MASSNETLKVQSSDCMNSSSPTKYRNLHCSQSCKKLYLQEDTADVHFVFRVGEVEKRAPAHKFLLGIGSPVFHSMFYGSLHEEGDIKIVDATFDAFKEFLQFFYLDHVTIALKYVDEMMYLANKYDVPECLNVCETFLKNNLPMDNICYVLQLAVTLNRSKFVAFLLAKISEKPAEIFASNSFKVCSRSILKMILELDNLACDEKAVFDACMAWSKKACEINNLDPMDMKNRREQLADCFHLINFDVMKPAHVSLCISEYNNLFSRDELVKIIVMLSSDNCINVRASNRGRASRNIRQWQENSVLVVSRAYGENLYYVCQTEETAFKTNKKLRLGAVATPPINPRTRDKTELSGVMKIVDYTSDRKILLEQLIDLALGGKFEPRNIIKLSQPIDVEPNKMYDDDIRIEFGSSWCENVYDTKKITSAQVQSFGDCKIKFGKEECGNGLVSHLYFN